jgi:hypothetical protein
MAIQRKFGDIAVLMDAHAVLVHGARFQSDHFTADPASFRERLSIHRASKLKAEKSLTLL